MAALTKAYKITVSIPQEFGQNLILKYTVFEYKIKDNRISFIDTKTGMLKDFPGELVLIEEIKGEKKVGLRDYAKA